jgi:hypothetical protein
MAVIPQVSGLPKFVAPGIAPALDPAPSSAPLASHTKPAYVAASAPAQAASALPAPSAEGDADVEAEAVSALPERWAAIESVPEEEIPETEEAAVVATGSPVDHPTLTAAKAVDSVDLDGVRTSMLAQRPYVRTRVLLQEVLPTFLAH